MEGAVYEESKLVVLGGIGSSDGQMAEGSELQLVKRKRVEENHVSRVQSGIDASEGEMGRGSQIHQVKHKKVKKKKKKSAPRGVDASHGKLRIQVEPKYFHKNWSLERGGVQVSIEPKYAELALKYYEKCISRDAEFELKKVRFSIHALLIVPGFKGVRQWCHTGFIAKRKGAYFDDDPPQQFFGELLLDYASGIHKVTHCSTLVPTDPGLSHGCKFCPPCSYYLHPADGYLTGDLSCTRYSKY